MNDRFSLLIIKYLDGTLNATEAEELILFTKENPELQKELAEAILQASTIRDILLSEEKVHDELGPNGTLKPFQHKQKYKSHRFKTTSKPIVKMTTKKKKGTSYTSLWIAALFILGIAAFLLFSNRPVNQETPQNRIVEQQPIHPLQNYAQITQLIGEVQLLRDGQRQTLRKTDSIQAKDNIITSAKSFLAFKSNQGSQIFLNEGTEIRVEDSEFIIKHGDLYAEIKKGDHQAFYSYSAPNKSRVKITGTSFEWSYYSPKQKATLKVREGSVSFINHDKIVIIKAHQKMDNETMTQAIQKIKDAEIAPWQALLKHYQENIYYIDTFQQEETFSPFWSFQTNQTNQQANPTQGLSCSGLNKNASLASPMIPSLQDDKMANFHFSTKSIQGEGEFEYGYEVLSQHGTPLIQMGYSVSQTPDGNYKISEIHTATDETGENPFEPAPSPSKIVTSLPEISWNTESLKIHKNKLAQETSSDGKKRTVTQVARDHHIDTALSIKFFVKTKNPSSSVSWSFHRFIVGYGFSINTLNKLAQTIDAANEKP